MSQADVAFLLGKKRSEDVLRYEKSRHGPNLETALAYEAIFTIPVSELFGGLYQKIEAKVAERRKTLAQKKKGGAGGPTPRRGGCSTGGISMTP
jgi:DNA-binding XRE family transcriptional regulator